MKVYVLSYYSKGKREATDGVYGVYSSNVKAWRQMDKIIADFDEIIFDFDIGVHNQVIYTDKGTYLIEIMEVDDE